MSPKGGSVTLYTNPKDGSIVRTISLVFNIHLGIDFICKFKLNFIRFYDS